MNVQTMSCTNIRIQSCSITPLKNKIRKTRKCYVRPDSVRWTQSCLKGKGVLPAEVRDQVHSAPEPPPQFNVWSQQENAPEPRPYLNRWPSSRAEKKDRTSQIIFADVPLCGQFATNFTQVQQ